MLYKEYEISLIQDGNNGEWRTVVSRPDGRGMRVGNFPQVHKTIIASAHEQTEDKAIKQTKLLIDTKDAIRLEE